MYVCAQLQNDCIKLYNCLLEGINSMETCEKSQVNNEHANGITK